MGTPRTRSEKVVAPEHAGASVRTVAAAVRALETVADSMGSARRYRRDTQLRGVSFSPSFAYAPTIGETAARYFSRPVMTQHTLLQRGGIDSTAFVAPSGCTWETLEEAETKPTVVETDPLVDQRGPSRNGGTVGDRSANSSSSGSVGSTLPARPASVSSPAASRRWSRPASRVRRSKRTDATPESRRRSGESHP